MTGSSYVGFTYNTKKRTCDVFKTHDTSAGLATEEDTKIYVKAGEVECLASSQCPKISELSQPECVLMKCQYCRPHHLTVSPNWQTDPSPFWPGHGGDHRALQVHQEVLRQSRRGVPVQTPTPRLVESQAASEQVARPRNIRKLTTTIIMSVFRTLQFNISSDCLTAHSVVCTYILLSSPPPSPHYLFWPDRTDSWPSHVSINFYQECL